MSSLSFLRFCGSFIFYPICFFCNPKENQHRLCLDTFSKKISTFCPQSLNLAVICLIRITGVAPLAYLSELYTKACTSNKESEMRK